MPEIKAITEALNGPIFPRGALLGGAAIIGITILCAGAGRLANLGTTHVPVTEAVETRILQFLDSSDGSILVKEAGNEKIVAVLAPASNGFIRGTLRGLSRDRKLRHLGPEDPFVLTKRSDGHFFLNDPGTGRQIELSGFGQTNFGAFAQLMRSEEPKR